MCRIRNLKEKNDGGRRGKDEQNASPVLLVLFLISHTSKGDFARGMPDGAETFCVHT